MSAIVTITAPAEKPGLAQALASAIQVLASPEGQEYRTLKNSGADIRALAEWADAVPPGPARTRRRVLTYPDLWGASKASLAQTLTTDEPAVLVTQAQMDRMQAAFAAREPEWQAEWNAATEALRTRNPGPRRG
jgi:hypothetical protein